MALSWSLVVVNAATWFNFFSSAYIRMPNPKKIKKTEIESNRKNSKKRIRKTRNEKIA